MKIIDQVTTESLQERFQSWPVLNAYERTKKACLVYTEAGLSIPAWTTLRDVIGKGSANDINRGKEDFRREMAQQLAAVASLPKDAPALLMKMLLDIWQEALRMASQNFEKEKIAFSEQLASKNTTIKSLEDELVAVEDENGEYEEALIQRDAQIDALREHVSTLKTQLAVQQQVNVSLEERQQESHQRLLAAQGEIEAAITRLEGVELHALMRIEEAREEAKKQVQTLVARHNREVQDWKLREAKLMTRLADTEKAIQKYQQELMETTALLQAEQHRADAAQAMVKSLAATTQPGVIKRRLPKRRST